MGIRGFRTTPLFRLALFMFLAHSIFIPSANAQVDPRGKTRTLRTAHFRVHYPVALDSLARRSAYLAEQAYGELARELATPAGPIDLLVQDNLDLSNGFAQTVPSNRITIYSTPPVALAELRYHDDWLRLVITHELAHIFHIDRARGLWRLGRWVFGRNELFFPNASLPSWVKEGLAVHYESKLTGGGRLVSTESRTVAGAAAHANQIPGPDAWSAQTSRYPVGETRYAWGMQLMHRQATLGGDSSMRKFVDQTATFPIPFLLNRSAKLTFGKSFNGRFAELRDSLVRAATTTATAGDSAWRLVTSSSELGVWNAAYPRWRNDSTIEYVTSNGRDVTGLYSIAVRGLDPSGALPSAKSTGASTDANGRLTVPAQLAKTSAPQRIARRNSLDINAVGPRGTSVFSQLEFDNPYEVRSDLYRRDSTGDHRITHNARLIQPDVREKDGAIVAVQITPGGTRLVRVINDSVVPLREYPGTEWAEPRWDPTFQDIVAVQLVRSGAQRIVLLDTLGNIARIVAESRAVLSTPAFVPNAIAVVWASDRSGKMQLETADISQAYTRTNMSEVNDGVVTLRATPIVDTIWRAEVHAASNVSTGIYQPDVSSDGSYVTALLYRNNGFAVVVAPFAGDGPVVQDSWYNGKTPAPNIDSTFRGASGAYRPLRQLVPKYWQPVIGDARDSGSLLGASTANEDILGRHSYFASALVNPRNGEVNGDIAYRYAGLGVPTISTSFSQDWDATFQLNDTVGRPLGLLARRIQIASLSAGWSIPRVRWSASYAIGAQYERRNFASETDSILGAPNSILRTGTRYPSLFVSGSYSNLARGARGISAEQGIAASASVSVRKREGVANSESFRSVGVLRGYLPFPFPSPYARQVLATRVAVGITDKKASTDFSVGGISGSLAELVPGVSIGDPSRTFPVRGFTPGSQRGMRAISASTEYRAPLAILARGAGLFPFFVDRFSATAFADAARAWCPSNTADRVAALCESPGRRDGWLASAGAELNIDLALQYDTPYRLRLGVAKPFAAPRELSRNPSFYITLGAFF